MRESTPRQHAVVGRYGAGYSQVELMVVIVIVLLLASILIGAGSKIVTQIKIKRTRSLLATLAAIATEYEVVMGEPETLAYSIEAFVVNAKEAPTTKQMLSALGSDAYKTIDNTVKDKWGNPLRYVPSNEHDNSETWYTGELPQYPRPFFASAGPDGEFGQLDSEATVAQQEQAEDNLYSYNID